MLISSETLEKKESACTMDDKNRKIMSLKYFLESEKAIKGNINVKKTLNAEQSRKTRIVLKYDISFICL
jgi:hypothetical protein